MQDIVEYIEEECFDCLLFGNCFFFNNIVAIEDLMNENLVSVCDSLGRCKIKAEIDLKLRGWVQVGKKTKTKC